MAIKQIRICREVPKLHKLFFQRAIEAFIGCVVFWRMDAGDILPDAQRLAGILKLPLKLRSIVMSCILDLTLTKPMQASEEICGISGAFGLVHPRESKFRMLVDGGEDISFNPLPVDHDGIEAKEESGQGFGFEIGDLLALYTQRSFTVNARLLYRMVIEPVFLDDFLDLPAGDGLVVFCGI